MCCLIISFNQSFTAFCAALVVFVVLRCSHKKTSLAPSRLLPAGAPGTQGGSLVPAARRTESRKWLREPPELPANLEPELELELELEPESELELGLVRKRCSEGACSQKGCFLFGLRINKKIF